ncbi:hypothetical protein GCM10023168_27310 [Fodinibacter luteus]|uniref:Integral membrane protein n=1 Tax=Fodinibacter luteus TaxID=552064 RepID=A0ABP8KM17_9MICO
MDAAPEPVLPPGLTTALGGPRGRRLRPSGGGPLAALAPVVLLLALPLATALLRQAGCLGTGWRGGTPVWRQCASPLVESLPAADLGRGLAAYLTGAVRLDEPALSGAVTALLAGLAPGGGTTQQRWFLALWVVLVALVLAGLVVAVGTVRDHPRADPVALALSPVLALTVLLSSELVPLAFAVLTLWAWTHARVRLAGVAGGLALLAGPVSALVLLAAALLPAPGGRAVVRRLLGTAAVTALAVAVPVALLDVGTLARPYAAWSGAGAGPGSPWYLFTLAGLPVRPGHVAVIAGLGWVLAAALVVVLSRRRPRPVVAAAALVGVAAVLMTAPSFPPYAAIWVVPFVALVGVRWRDHLVWALAEAVHAVALFGHLTAQTDPTHGLPAGWYALALVLRLVAVGWVARQAWVSGGLPDAVPRPFASWGDPAAAGTLSRLPSERPVDNSPGPVGSSAYPPVTEGP